MAHDVNIPSIADPFYSDRLSIPTIPDDKVKFAPRKTEELVFSPRLGQ